MTAIPAEIRAEIEKLVRKHGENPEGRYFVPLANAYRRSGGVSEAIAILRKGIRRHPDYLSARIVLGHCYADQGDAEAARSEYQHVLSFDPHNLVALRSLGELAAAAGNDDEARRRYEQLLAVDPMNEEARAGLQMLSHGSALAGFAHALEPGAEEDDAPGGGDVIPAFPRAQAPASTEATAGVAATPGALAPPPEETDVEVLLPGGDDNGEYDGEEIVVTETIAELYTRQGFFTRAAHVYRELLRRHGEDPRLRDRLNRVERLALGEESLAAASAPAPSMPADRSGRVEVLPPTETAESSAASVAGADITGDSFADSFASGFPRVEIDDVEIVAVSGVVGGATDVEITVQGGESPAAEVPGPVAAAIEPPAAPSPEPNRIGDYLLGVLDWGGRPDRQSSASEVAEPSAEAHELVDEDRPPTADTERSVEDAAPPRVDARAAEPGDDLFPWEMPETAGSAPTVPPARPATPSVTASPFAFDDATRASASEPPVRDGVARVPPVSSGPVTPAATSATSAAPDDDDEEDDIESFQAWLRSLKR